MLRVEETEQYIEVIHKETGEHRPARADENGLVIDEEGGFDEQEWDIDITTGTPIEPE